MKKTFIALASTIIVCAVLGGVWYFIAHHHTVLFDYQNGNYQLEVDNSAGKKVATVDHNSSSLWLWDGAYSYKVLGGKYDGSAQDFRVADQDQSITVNPDYSSNYLANLLTNTVENTIFAALQPDLGTVPSNQYSYTNLNLYGRGQWAAGTISYQPTSQDIAEIYRFVLEQNSKTGAWQVIVKPIIAIYAADYPQIPRSLLDSLYGPSS